MSRKRLSSADHVHFRRLKDIYSGTRHVTRLQRIQRLSVDNFMLNENVQQIMRRSNFRVPRPFYHTHIFSDPGAARGGWGQNNLTGA